jgi:hypothetical protein
MEEVIKAAHDAFAASQFVCSDTFSFQSTKFTHLPWKVSPRVRKMYSRERQLESWSSRSQTEYWVAIGWGLYAAWCSIYVNGLTPESHRKAVCQEELGQPCPIRYVLDVSTLFRLVPVSSHLVSALSTRVLNGWQRIASPWLPYVS